MGKAIVSTTLGCEGLDVRVTRRTPPPGPTSRPDSHGKVLCLLEDEPLAKTLGRQGRALMEDAYGWEPITRRLEAVYRAMLSQEGAENDARPSA